MELVNRYIHAVTSKLPAAQREEIEKELRGLIEDMLEECTQGGERKAQDVEKVLQELGNPSALADKYRGTKRYLIGPELFDSYLSVLKVVLASIGIAMVVMFIIRTVMNPLEIAGHLIDTMQSLVFAGLQGFTWVTLAFGLIEYFGVRDGKSVAAKAAAAWKPSSLPPVPDRHTRIKRADPIASIVFTILFTAFFTFSPELIGIWVGGPANAVPFFDLDTFRGFVPWIWVVTVFSVLKDSVKLLAARWTMKLVGLELLVVLSHVILAVFMFNHPNIWNSQFMEQLAQSGFIPVGSEGYEKVLMIWDNVRSGILYAIVVVFVLELIGVIAKAWKIGRG